MSRSYNILLSTKNLISNIFFGLGIDERKNIMWRFDIENCSLPDSDKHDKLKAVNLVSMI